MTDPGSSQVALNAEEVQRAEIRYAEMEANLTAIQAQLQEKERELQDERERRHAIETRHTRASHLSADDIARLVISVVNEIQPPQGVHGTMDSEGHESARFEVKMEKPATFNGAKDKDVDTWLFSISEYMAFLKIREDTMVQYASSLLRGNAALWWREICENDDRPDTWESFQTLLREQFRSENLIRRARDELANLHQKEKESIPDFLHKFRQICLRIKNLDENEKLDKFCRALLPHIRTEVELREPRSFAEAAHVADRVDEIMSSVTGHGTCPRPRWNYRGSSSKTTGLRAPSNNGSSSNGPQPMDIGAVQRTPLSSEIREQLRRTDGCFYCRKPNAGHWSRNCPLKKNSGTRKNQQGNGQGR